MTEEQPERLRAFLAEISVEPILFLAYMGMFMKAVVRENLKLDRFCRITLQYDEKDCAHLNDGEHEELQVETQKLDSVFLFYERVVSTVIPVLLMVFLASWSDRRGRKMLLLMCFIGDIMYSLVYLLESLFPSWPPEVLLLAAFLQSIGGGTMMMLMAAYSFIADKTSKSSRTFRLTITNAVMHLGGPVGTALGAWIFAIKGYAWVFGLSVIISVTCLILVLLLIDDKKPSADADDPKKARKPWDPRNVLDLFRSYFKTRPCRGRLHLILLTTFMLALMSANPHSLYLWCRRVFLWDENQYSLYSAVNQVTEYAVSLVFAAILHTKALHDCVVGGGTSVFLFLKDLSLGLTTSPSQWYVVYIFLFIPQALIPGAVRGQMSKICKEDEVGCVFSVMAILEVLWPMANSALFTFVYTSTLDFYPSFEHLVSAAFAAYIVSGFLALRLSIGKQEMITEPLKEATDTQSNENI